MVTYSNVLFCAAGKLPKVSHPTLRCIDVIRLTSWAVEPSLPNRRLQLSGAPRLAANLQFHLPLSNLP